MKGLRLAAIVKVPRGSEIGRKLMTIHGNLGVINLMGDFRIGWLGVPVFRARSGFSLITAICLEYSGAENIPSKKYCK